MAGALGDVCIDLVEYQVKEMGGILRGREIEVVRCDTRSTIAGAVACGRQLLYEDEVAAVCGGGWCAADAQAVNEFAEERELPCFLYGGIPMDVAD
jgi:ABC-type branched-subunit amino acid transport system substrate-binding protein